MARLAAGLALAGLAALWLCASAGAEVEFCTEESEGAQCPNPFGIAADSAEAGEGSGQIYVAERDLDEVLVFEANGSHLFSFGETGAGAGQLNQPRSVAVDNVSPEPPPTGGRHRVYLYEAINRRVSAFDPEGNFLWMAGREVNAGTGDPNLCTDDGAPENVCQAGSAGTGPGEFSGLNSFVSVGPGGVLHVSDAPTSIEPRVQKFTHEGELIEVVALEHKGDLGDSSNAMAVDPVTGDIYARFVGSGIYKFEPSGAKYPPPYPLDEGTVTTALGTDGAGNLYAGQSESRAKPPGSYRIITAYSPGGAHLGRFGYGQLEFTIRGVGALDTASGDVLVAEAGLGGVGAAARYLDLPGPLGETGPVVAGPSVEAPAGEVSNTKALLEAEINPEGEETSYRFDYVDKESFDTEGGFESPNTKSTPEESLDEGAADFRLRYVSEQIGCPDPVNDPPEDCLIPETKYLFRVIATNADNPEGEGAARVVGEFTTKSSVEHLATYATEPGSDTMRLNMRIDPLGVPASGYFEYVEESVCKAAEAAAEGEGKTPEEIAEACFETATQIPDIEGGQSPLDFGAAEGGVTRSATIYPLAPATAHRYRAVADNELIEPLPGPERGFRTFAEPVVEAGCANAALRSGPSAKLPDCRAYELVSPLDKAGGDVITLEEGTRHIPAQLDKASVSGERLTYTAYRPFAGAEGAPYVSQYLAERDPGAGWANRGISPPREHPILPPFALGDTEFKAASDDLCSFWLRSLFDPTLAEGAIAKYPNLYRRDVSGAGCGEPGYTALTTNEPAHESTINPGFPGEGYVSLELQGVSADGARAIYAVTDNLTAKAPNTEGKDLALYEWEEGAPLRYGCILPGEAAFEEGCSGGYATSKPIPAGGGRSHFNSLDGAISEDGARVYWTAAGGTGTGSGPIYMRDEGATTTAVSETAEGEEASTDSRFHLAAKDGGRVVFETGGTLYEYTPEGDETNPIAAQFLGVLGASEDASRVYFASKADLDDGAQAGEPNLYLHEAGAEPRFIATLDDADLTASAVPSPLDPKPVRHLAEVSPDGRHAAFNSFASLTGYDNTDAKSGETDSEVYRYDAEAAGGEGELRCVSCNPSGARPEGANVARVFGESVAEFWAGAYLPGAESSLYAARALSEDGSRVFFHSSDKLSPHDSNGVQDLYQWEAPGAGGCDEGDPGFSEPAGGCIDLISSGKGSYPATLVDASPSGDDVFFSTLASLVSADKELVDIYDARVGGGFAEPPPPPPECEGEACQNPATAPEAKTPSSSTYRGPGNLAAPKKKANKKRCPKGKRKVKRKGKVRCIKKRRHRASARHNRVHPSRRAAR